MASSTGGNPFRLQVDGRNECIAQDAVALSGPSSQEIQHPPPALPAAGGAGQSTMRSLRADTVVGCSVFANLKADLDQEKAPVL